jgi:hypothetical protein
MLDSFLPTGRISSLLNMQPKFLVLEVQKITNFLELTFFSRFGWALAVP